MSSQTFNIIKASLVNDSSNPPTVTQVLDLLITPQPTTVNGVSVPSSYVSSYEIPNPTQAQIQAYTPTSGTPTPTITLSTNV